MIVLRQYAVSCIKVLALAALLGYPPAMKGQTGIHLENTEEGEWLQQYIEKTAPALGFVNADSTHMFLKEATSSKIQRRAIIGNEYDVLLLVGDNLADFSGIYESRGDDFGFAAVDADRELFGTQYIILPNPMYGNWLNELMNRSGKGTTREKLLRMLETF